MIARALNGLAGRKVLALPGVGADGVEAVGPSA